MNQRELNIIDSYLSSGNYNSAIEELKNILGKDPEDAHAHAVLALALLDTKRVAAARHEIEIALAMEADNDYFQYISSAICLSEGDLKKALLYIKEALRINSEALIYYSHLADIYIFMGKRDKAINIIDELLSIEPNNIEALNAKAKFLFKKRKYRESEKYILRSLEQDSLNQEALIIHGELLLHFGDYASAKDNSLEVLKQDSENINALNLLMACKFKKNPFTGLWWRFNAFMQKLTSSKQVIYLLLMYVVYRLTIFLLIDTGNEGYTGYVTAAWFAFVIYTWISPAIFNGLLKKDLKKIELNNF